MHLTAYALLLGALVSALCGSGLSVWSAWKSPAAPNAQPAGLGWIEKLHLISTALLSVACLILLRALAGRDMSFEYVAGHTDKTLPLFYAVTAFWAGQAGSILFWQWMIALLGLWFLFGKGYERLPGRVKVFFWCFFFPLNAFFLSLLAGINNPFLELVPPPPDGAGLNPLLQNVGMIFHPPLLFLGYAGFAVPACLAFARQMTGESPSTGPDSWLTEGRDWCLVAWALLSAGILLGAWWSYMELGWGGYWAWDPVENASLIPWLSATALLHTGVIQTRGGGLKRTNIFLIGLTLMLCYFATFLVRGGAIESLHAFGDGGVGAPLMILIGAGMFVTLALAFSEPGEPGKGMPDMTSRPGLLFWSAMLFLILGGVVLMGTLWPLIGKLFITPPPPVPDAAGHLHEGVKGLTPAFYNKTCMPLFALIGLFFTFCPWMGWKQGTRDKAGLMIVLGALVGSAGLFFALGIRLPVALLGAASAVAGLVGVVLAFVRLPETTRSRRTGAAYVMHAGLMMMFLGVAFSGPYQQEAETMLNPGQSFEMAGYTFTYVNHSEGQDEHKMWYEAVLEVKKDGKPVGTLSPQRRIYRTFQQPFAEVSTIFSLGDELYSTLLTINESDGIGVKLSIHPLINWIWIGSVILCVAPFLMLTGDKPARPAYAPHTGGDAETGGRAA